MICQKLLPALVFGALVFTTPVVVHADPAFAGHDNYQDQSDGSSSDRDGGQHRPDRDHHGRHDGLNLTDSQRVAFRTAMRQMGDAMHDSRDLHEELRDLTESDNYSESKVRDLLHKHEASIENNLVSASKTMHDFYASLTPEQKEQFNDMRSQMRKRMIDGMRDRHHDHHDDDEERDPMD